MNNGEFLSEPIWLNKRFYIKNKPIFLSNWTKSGILYVKDLFDQNGRLLKEQRIYNMLIHKNNWIAEYFKIKKIFTSKVIKDIDTSQSKNINIKSNWTILVNNKITHVVSQKSNFYYNILIVKKRIKNYMEHV